MRKVVLAFATLLLVAILYGYFLPGTWHVERQVTIAAPKAVVFPWISSLEKWPGWAMPKDLVPEVATEKTLKWAGGGHIEVTEVVPDTSVSYELRYTDKEKPVRGKIVLEEVSPESTTIRWTDDGEMGKNPIARYFISSVVRDVGNDMQQGLARLKEAVEKSYAANKG